MRKSLLLNCLLDGEVYASIITADIDFGKKFSFTKDTKFGTAGSCFAMHFGRSLKSRGGKVLEVESRHPLVADKSSHGYGEFSARYGNIYTSRQLKELLEQATGRRPTIYHFETREDGRYIDMLRPRAIPDGFSSEESASLDRKFHLRCVRDLLTKVDVFVFTLGLTETWVNKGASYCYPVVPGAIAGIFDENLYVFSNLMAHEVIEDIEICSSILISENPNAKILLTVSPVNLVATAEKKSVIVSTIASKSALRTACEYLVNRYDHIDYFPSYEIITSSYARSQFWSAGLRDVTHAGVDQVMSIFFASRLEQFFATHVLTSEKDIQNIHSMEKLQKAITEECDEMFLDNSLKNSNI